MRRVIIRFGGEAGPEWEFRWRPRDAGGSAGVGEEGGFQ